jgi:hypothetical protein
MASYTGVLIHSEAAVSQDLILDNLRTSLNRRHLQCHNISLLCHNFILGPLTKICLSSCLVKDTEELRRQHLICSNWKMYPVKKKRD